MMDTLKVGHKFTLPFEQELRAHLAWLIKLRWLAASGVVATTWGAQVLFRFKVPATALYGIGLIIFFYNALYSLFYVRKVAKASKGNVVFLNRFAHLQIGVDWLVLICLVHYSGGIESPLIFYFILHIILASILLSRRACYLHTTFAVLLLIATATLEYHRIVPHVAIEGFSSQVVSYDAVSIFGYFLFFGSMLYISAFLAASVTNKLRDREKELSISKKSLEQAYRDLKELDKAKTEQLIQTRKLAFIGHFSSGVAHEINNPLGGILNCTRMLLSSPAIKDEKRQYLELILKGLIRIEHTVRQLLTFSHQHEFEPQLMDVHAVLQEALFFTEHRAKEQKVDIERVLLSSLPPIIAEPSQLQQVFLNIVKNALDAMPDGGELRIRTGRRDKEIFIEFADTGIGIKQEDISQIFDPFFTMKEVGEGVGLGLSVSYGIIQQHEGRIQVESKEGEGTTVTILLPIRTDLSDGEENNEQEQDINS